MLKQVQHDEPCVSLQFITPKPTVNDRNKRLDGQQTPTKVSQACFPPIIATHLKTKHYTVANHAIFS